MREDSVKLLQCASSFPSVFSHTLFSVEHQEALSFSPLLSFLLQDPDNVHSCNSKAQQCKLHLLQSPSLPHMRSLSLSLSAHCIPIPPLLSLQSNQHLLLPTAPFSFSLSSSSFFKDKSQPASVRSPFSHTSI